LKREAFEIKLKKRLTENEGAVRCAPLQTEGLKAPKDEKEFDERG